MRLLRESQPSDPYGSALVRSRLAKILAPLVLLIVAGVLGYEWIEGWSFLDSLYMVAITLGTVGFSEVHPLSDGGRVFTIFLVAGGVGLVTFTVGMVTRMIIEGELRMILGRRRAMSKIKNLKDHYIINGYGRIGSLVASEFQKKPLPFVVIERNEQKVLALPQEFPVLHGDGTEEEVLLQAGIERARGLVTVLHSDADNLFVTLTARDLNPKLFIIARYEEPRSEMKLLRAGADKVISPYIIGGTRMAMAVLKPAVIDFIELATQTESLGLQMEEVLLAGGSRLIGVPLASTEIRSKLDTIIVAIKRKGGHMEFNPSASSTLEEGDKLIAIGEREQLGRLEAMARR
ncbi:MAG: potassium channel protein [Deltaproteobacteria bacterium]|nr:potassium channel protein [Deltaproteobacteria bacterium]